MLKKYSKDQLSYFEKQLVFYGAYHNTPGNVVIHCIFVPLIAWTTLGLLSQVGDVFSIHLFNQVYNIDLSMLLTLTYVTYYIKSEFTAGVLITPILVFVNWSVIKYNQANPKSSLSFELLLFIISWLAQFASHFFIEKRSPALIDGFFQAVSLAPLFVFLEILFQLGYNPSYKPKVMSLISLEIGSFKAEQIKSNKQ
ncbi:DUF962-domain-containing protein [Neoconidiobolus thromboides FSU 785]|nr:DUF962-domain-containing protein [Neoconidiobolus thromboides FSU 785]